MKTRLIKSCAIGAMLCAATGMAQATEEPQLSIGGYFTQSFNLANIDTAVGDTIEEEVLAQNAEIHFTAKTTLDNGTVLGIRLELEGDESDDQIDEHYLYATGDWGKLIIGAENGVGHLMQVRAPAFVPGLKMYDNSLTDAGIERAYDALLGVNIIEDAHMSTKLEHISGDANKVSYITPKIGGLQLAASFTPNNEDTQGGETNAGLIFDGQQEDIIELAVTFSGRAGGVKYRVGYSNIDADTAHSDPDSASPPDPESTSIGLELSAGRWKFGGNLSEYNDLGSVGTRYRDSEKIETLNFGLRYGTEDYYVGFGWTESEEDKIGVNGVATEYDEFMVGGGIKLAEGVSLGYYYSESEVERPQITGPANSGGEISTLGLLVDLRF